MKIPSMPTFVVGSLWLLIGACGSSSDPPSASAPWTRASDGIEVTCGSFFGGSMKFEARRSQLSAAQLDLLSALTVIEPKQGCSEDVPSCAITVTDAQGAVSTYSSTYGDPACPGISSPVISYASLGPFLQTVGCRYSKASFSSDSDPGVVPDERWLNGLFTSGPGTVTVNLQVDAPGARHIELDLCNGANQLGRLTATLVLPPDSTSLATLAPVDAASAGPDGACASLDYTFAQAGTYQLDIVIAEGFLPVGDFFLKYY